MEFAYPQKREWRNGAQRSVVMGTHGMAASSQHLATLSGYRVLAGGGNAVDAAVAMASTLSVVEPYSIGLGGDAFALIYLAGEKKLVGMNGSGRAPDRAHLEWFAEQGIKEIPERGILSVTVPGALHGWAQAVERYGRLSLSEVFGDAMEYAENGFPVTEIISGEWKYLEETLLLSGCSSNAYLAHGKAPEPGQVFINRDLARTYQKIVREGVGIFYEGEICDAIIKTSGRCGGLFSERDFRDHQTAWVEPLSTDYRGYRICELPPNGQGLTVLEMLNILEGYDLRDLGRQDAEYLHLLIEAKKAAFHDRDRFIADPEFETIPTDRLLSKEYALEVRKRIDRHRASSPPLFCSTAAGSDTAYMTAVDGERNACSFISSLFMGFGSGIVVEGTGIVLQNRGKSFSLDPGHVNRIAPRKRPMHTIIPGMVLKDGEFLMSFGVMGGDMQPQGHVQFLVNVLDFGMNLQEAIDTSRIRHLHGMEVYAEDGIPDGILSELARKGHRIIRDRSPVNQVGGGQAICLDPARGVLLGGSDRRKDGCAIGY
jgi:gamma-glutamyltranspeptidase/glutathione hydrolase